MPTTSTASRPLTPWIVASLVCALIMGAAWWRTNASRTPMVANTIPVAEVADAPVAHRASSTPASRVDALAPEDPMALVVAERKRVQGMVDRTRETFIARHAAERVDAAWSNTMERELADLSDSGQMRAMNANISNLEVDCRSSMCRVRGDVASMTAGDDWFTLYMTNVGARLPEASYRYVTDDDGKLHIEIFAIGRR